MEEARVMADTIIRTEPTNSAFGGFRYRPERTLDQ